MKLFWSREDYEAFERVVEEAFERTGTGILAYCVMPVTGIPCFRCGRMENSRSDSLADWLIPCPDVWLAMVNAAQTEALLDPPPARTIQEEVVRRYRLQPTQSARDLRTGISTRNLHGLWNGDLDEFLIAAMALSHPPAALPAELPEIA